MSFQSSRLALAEALSLLVDGWTVTTATATDENIFHRQIVVGHASRIYSDHFGGASAELLITIWVSEADDMGAAESLYTMLSPGPGSLTKALTAALGPQAILVGEAANIGRRDEGPSGFLAGDLTVTLLIDMGL